MHQRLPQCFGVGFTMQVLQRDGVRCPVVLHHQRVVHRQVRGARVEVAQRVATAHHHVAHQQVRLGDRGAGAVHEARLHGLPFHAEALRLVGRQRQDLELVPALLARAQFRLGLRAAARARHRALVLRSETPCQALRALAAREHGKADHREQQQDGDRQQQVGVHGESPWAWRLHRAHRQTSSIRPRARAFVACCNRLL